MPAAAAPQAYDPTSAQPYTPVAAPATPEPRESPFQGQPGINMTNMGAATRGGQIAGLFDNVLHGFVNGMAQGQQHKALTLKKKSDDLTASYNADAQRAYEYARQKVAQDGKLDPNDPEYQKLKSAVDGSWGALHDFRGGLLQDQMGKKKGKQDQGRSPAEILSDRKSTPQEKAYVLWQIGGKAGAPVYGQIQSLVAWANSPQAQQQRQTQADIAAAQGSQASANRKLFDSVNEYATLIAKPNPTAEDAKRIEALKVQIPQMREALNPTKIPAAESHRYSEDGKEEYEVDAEGNEIPNTRRPRSTTEKKPRPAWGKDEHGKNYSVLLDPETNQEVPDSRNFNVTAPASIAGSIHTGEHFWVDNNNKVLETPYTGTSRPAGSAGPAVGPTAPSAAQTPPQPQSGAAATPLDVQAAPTATSAGPTRRTKPPKTVGEAGSPADATGTKTLGYAKITGPDAKELNDATTQYHNALKALEESRHAVRDRLNGENVSLADKGIALAWIHARMSRITQKEIDAVNKLGGLQMAFDGTAARIVGGEMSNAQRAEFLRGANEAYQDSLKDLNDVRTRLHLPPISAGGTNTNPNAHKVGDVVEVNGQKVKITAIDPNTGKATGDPVP